MGSLLFQKHKKHHNILLIENFSISAGKPASIKSKYQILSDSQFNSLIFNVHPLSFSQKPSILQARVLVAYQLLRISMFKVSDLLWITVGQMKEFQKTSILEIVNSRHSHGLRLHLTGKARDCFFRNCEHSLDVLYHGKGLQYPLFHGRNLLKQINRSTFSRRLNELLKNKNITLLDFPITTSSLRVSNGNIQGWIETSRSSRDTGQLFIKTSESNVLNGNTPATLKKSESLKKAGVLSAEHFDLLISSIYCPTRPQKRTLSQVRTRVAFFILRICNLKVSGLSQITVGQIKVFLTTSVLEFRGGFFFSKKASIFLNLCLPSLEILFLGKNPNDPLFHGACTQIKLDTKVLCRELNAPLKNKDTLRLDFPLKLSSLYDEDSFPWETK